MTKLIALGLGCLFSVSAFAAVPKSISVSGINAGDIFLALSTLGDDADAAPTVGKTVVKADVIGCWARTEAAPQDPNLQGQSSTINGCEVVNRPMLDPGDDPDQLSTENATLMMMALKAAGVPVKGDMSNGEIWTSATSCTRTTTEKSGNKLSSTYSCKIQTEVMP